MRQAEAENYWLNSSNYWLNSLNCWLVARIKKKSLAPPRFGGRAKPDEELLRGELYAHTQFLAVGNAGSCSELDFPHILAV